MRSNASSIKEYLDELPEDRRKAIQAVRRVIRDNLPKGYEEVMNWGMITYQVPLGIFPLPCNGKPLLYPALASQKNHMAVYLTGIYMDSKARRKFESAYRASGKSCDAGKSCVRFKKIEDLPLDLIEDSIASLEMNDFVNRVKAVHPPRKKKDRSS